MARRGSPKKSSNNRPDGTGRLSASRVAQLKSEGAYGECRNCGAPGIYPYAAGHYKHGLCVACIDLPSTH